MGNTALKAIIGADATPFQRAMATVAAISTNTAGVTIRELQKAGAELEKMAAAGGRGSQFYREQLENVNKELTRLSILEQQATANAERLAEARARISAGRGRAEDRALISETPLTGSEVTRTTNNAARIEALKAEIAEKKRLHALEVERAAALTGSEVTQTTNNAGRIAALRAEYEEKKRLKALDAERSNSVSGDMVTRTTPDTARLARLRSAVMSGDKAEASAARVEIRALANLRRREREREGGGPESVRGRFGSAASAAELVHVLRATTDSLASGANPFTVMLQQGPQVLQALSMMEGGILGTIKALLRIPVGPWMIFAGVIAGLSAGFLIFRARVNSLVKDMIGPVRDAFSIDHIAKYLQKAGMMAELQKDVNDEIRRTKEAHDSVIASMDRQLELTKDRISFEKELLEVQKANELAAAKTPAEREAIEKKYSDKILAKKKEERDAELQHMKDLSAKLPDEIKKTRGDLAGAMGGGFTSDQQEKARARELRTKSAVYDKYRAELPEGEEDKRESSLQKDRETIAKLKALEGKQVMDRDSLTGTYRTYHLDDTQKQTLENAQKRIDESQQTKKAEDDFSDSGGDRERARARVHELQDKVKADEKRLAELGKTNKQKMDGAKSAREEAYAEARQKYDEAIKDPNNKEKHEAWRIANEKNEATIKAYDEARDNYKKDPNGAEGGEIADKEKANLQKDKEDLALEQERMNRTDHPGSTPTPRELTSNQRVGAYIGGSDIALLDVTKAMDRKLGQIVKNTSGKIGGSPSKVGGLRTK